MLSFFSRSCFATALLVTQGCSVDNDQAAAAHAICESNGMTFGTDAYWRCRVEGERDRRENQVIAFNMLMGAVQEVSSNQAIEIERFRRSLQEASAVLPPGDE